MKDSMIQHGRGVRPGRRQTGRAVESEGNWSRRQCGNNTRLPWQQDRQADQPMHLTTPPHALLSLLPLAARAVIAMSSQVRREDRIRLPPECRRNRGRPPPRPDTPCWFEKKGNQRHRHIERHQEIRNYCDCTYKRQISPLIIQEGRASCQVFGHIQVGQQFIFTEKLCDEKSRRNNLFDKE
jgi:hypothetical protein